MSSYQAHNGPSSKSRTKVKPILRKLTQSERNSLDLDRDGLGIEYGTGSRSSHDAVNRRGYHARSTSGTSQFSNTTTGSGHRTGSFVHPFQQTPRPYTPPLAASYANSLREDDDVNNHSPALTEDEELRQHTIRSASNISNRAPSITGAASSSPIVSHPVISHPLRIQTKNNSASRLALATSHTSLHNFSDFGSPDTMSPASAIRTSIDKGFRIRSRSEVNPAPRTETIQEARRKFQEKELLKEERAAREEIKALEKRQHKEAKEIERQHRRSSASDNTRSKRSKSDLASYEKGGTGNGLIGRGYNSVPFQTPPLPAEEAFSPRPRSYTAKHKTHSAWTKFVMWVRTRFLRMNKLRSS